MSDMTNDKSSDLPDLQKLLQIQDAVLAAAANERMAEVQEREDDIPVLPDLQTYQYPDIIANETGRAMMVYDRPLPDIVWWAEYDPDLALLSFVTVGKKIFGFGSKIHPSVDKFLRFSDSIYLVQVDDVGKIIKAEERKLVVRRNGRA